MKSVCHAFALAKATIFPRIPGDSGAPHHPFRSPAPHLFRSNAAPTHAEESLIREAIGSMSDALALLEEQLSFHDERHHKVLLAQKAALAGFVQRHQPLLSHLRRFPPEILVEIFTYLTPPTKCHVNINVPWQLCRVSRSWQAAALSCPLLWTEVCVDITKTQKGRRRAESYLRHLNLLLERSRGALLYVYIDVSRSLDSQHHPFVDALVLHCTRWQELSIKGTPPFLAAFQGIKDQLPNLSILSLDLTPCQKEGIIDLFKVAPKLSEVHLNGLVSPCDIHLPWSQLTSMWDKGGTMSNIQHVCVLASKQITDIRYSTSGQVSGPTSVPTATLAKLHTLVLDLKYGEHLRDFDNLTLPAVTTIQIAGYLGRLLPKLQIIVSRAATPSVLRKLAFRATDLEPGDLASMLEYTPLLEELDTPLPPRDDLLRLAIRHQGRHALVPNLQSLKLSVPDVDLRGYSDAINLFVASRCDPQPPLQDTDGASEQLSQPLNLRIFFRPGSEPCSHRVDKFEKILSPTTLDEAVNVETHLLAHWHDQMTELIPSLVSYEPMDKKKLSRKTLCHVDRLFSQIESHPLKHVEALHGSKLHLSIHRLSKLWAKKATGKKYQFSERAGRILKIWEPALRADLPNRRWAHLGVNSITYVPISSPLRTSDDAMTIIYGHDSELIAIFEEYAAFNFIPRDRLGQIEDLWTPGG